MVTLDEIAIACDWDELPILRLARAYYRTGQLDALDGLLVRRFSYTWLSDDYVEADVGQHDLGLFDCQPKLSHSPAIELESLTLTLPEMELALRASTLSGYHYLLLCKITGGGPEEELDGLCRSLKVLSGGTLCGDSLLVVAFLAARIEELGEEVELYISETRDQCVEIKQYAESLVKTPSISVVSRFAAYTVEVMERLLESDLEEYEVGAPIVLPVSAQHLHLEVHGGTQQGILQLIGEYGGRSPLAEEVLQQLQA